MGREGQPNVDVRIEKHDFHFFLLLFRNTFCRLNSFCPMILFVTFTPGHCLAINSCQFNLVFLINASKNEHVSIKLNGIETGNSECKNY